MAKHVKQNTQKKSQTNNNKNSQKRVNQGQQTRQVPTQQMRPVSPSQPRVNRAQQGRGVPVPPQNTFEQSPYYQQVPQIQKKSKKPLFITLGVILGIILIAYLAGAFYFSFTFFPNSKISSMDVSMKSTSTVESEINSNLNSYSINVSGSGLNFKVDSSSSDIKADTKKIIEDAKSKVNIWAWPLELIKTHDFTDEISNNLSEGNLGTLVKEKVDAANEDKTDSVDAHLAWDEKTSSFTIASEVYGTKIDATAVQKLITDAIVSMTSTVSVGSEQCIKPKILKTDTRFDSALTKANTYAKTNFKIMMGDTEAATVNGSTIQNWLVIGDDFSVTLNSDAVNTWATGIADGCNTIGTTRTYTRPDGNKTITVSGGTYGWEADGTGLSDEIITAINSGSTSPINVNVTQSANALVPKGQADWGGRWIDVDLTEQHAYMYDNGSLVWETDVVTGNPNIGDATPEGVWMVNNKQTNQELKGPVTNGQAEWESHVDYWIPFIANTHGLHDASWQSTFGGSAYQNLNWSHGCINLPTSKAPQLYELCKIGDAVIVHY